MEIEIELSKDTIIVTQTNEKGIIEFANEDFCKISGYTLNELVGNPHNMIRHKDMPKWAFEDLWKTIKSGRMWKGIVKNRTKNGGYYWVKANVYSSKNSDGSLRYISARAKPTKDEINKAILAYQNIVGKNAF
ncbi:PAS sensor-containing signal transduction protein [Aliarcobacter faecis]|uniref:PAS domain-containing protein n=1 Tax=Aliarcobacter faecis TaxID=1564138 RepID=UPI00155DC1FB|nr:PAS domain-containing protein [Aliarcobacter faecis]QKF73775.1 PAS sensor-containing signal transduction protein [Aliarcobacter faecis]